MQGRTLTKVFAIVVVALLLVLSVFLIFRHKEEAKFYPLEFIKYPTSTNPVILTAGNSFEIKVNSTPLVLGWNVSLYAKYQKVSALLQSEKYDNKSKLWKLVAKVPENAITSLYNLSVRAKTKEGELEFVQPRAVQVIDSFPENFSFVHITDIHIGKLGYNTIESFEQAINEINLINPSFVIITGDITDHDSEEEYATFYLLLQKFTVPTFVCVGNHDVYSSILKKREGQTYEKYIGDLNYTFRFGKYHFIVVNDVLSDYNGDGVCEDGEISEEQIEWIENYLRFYNGSGAKFLMMMHVPMFKPPEFGSQVLEPARSILLRLIGDYKVLGVFAGHHHRDYVVTYEGCKFINTVTVGAELGSGAKYCGYRIVYVREGKIYKYNYDNLSDQDTSNSMPAGKIHYFFSPNNDGTSENVTLKIVSELSEAVENSKASFVLKKPFKTYEIKMTASDGVNPRIIQSFESDDHSKIIVEVALNVPKDQTTIVSVAISSKS